MNKLTTPTPTAATKRAAIYLRVSSDAQEDNYSLPTQEASCRRWAAENGHDVAGIYKDVSTGTNTQRPGLDRLHDDIRAGKVDAVIVHAMDRISRNPGDWAGLAAEWKERECSTFSVTQPVGDGPLADMMRYILATVGGLDHASIVEKTSRGRRARAESGKIMPTGRALYGYTFNVDRTAYEIDPTTAPVAKRIFAAIAGGQSLRGLARELAADGIPSPKGEPTWSHTTLKDMLNHDAYPGDGAAYTYKTVKKRRGKDDDRGRPVKYRSRELRPMADRIALPPGTIPALVTRGEADAARAQLARNRAEHASRARDPAAFLLRAGFVVCSHCFSPLTATTKKDRQGKAHPTYRTFRAGPHQDCPYIAIRAWQLDAEVWQAIEKLRQTPDLLRAKVAELLDGDADSGLDGYRGTLAKLEKQIDTLTRRVADADDDDLYALLAARLKALAAERRDLAAKIAEREEIRQARQGRGAALEKLIDGLSGPFAPVQAKVMRATAEHLRGNADQGDAHYVARKLISLRPLRYAEGDSPDAVSNEYRQVAANFYQWQRSILAALGVKVILYPRGVNPRWELHTDLKLETVMVDEAS